MDVTRANPFAPPRSLSGSTRSTLELFLRYVRGMTLSLAVVGGLGLVVGGLGLVAATAANALQRDACTEYKRATGLLPPKDPAEAQAWEREQAKQRELYKRQEFLNAYEKRAARLRSPE